MGKSAVKDDRMSLASMLYKRGIEVFFVFALAFSMFTLLSLATYHIRDNFAFLGQDAVLNAGGFVGAWLSRALFIIFGYMAYSLPLFAAYFAYAVLKKTDSVQMLWHEISMRTIGFLLVLFSLSGIFSLENPYLWQVLPVSSGGVAGSFVAKPLYQLFSFSGSFLFLLGSFLIGVTLLTDISWLHFVEKVGEHTFNSTRWILNQLNIGSVIKEKTSQLATHIKERHQQRREQQEQQEQQERIEPEALVVEPVVREPIIRRRKHTPKLEEVVTDFNNDVPKNSFTFEKPTILRKPEQPKKTTVVPTSASDIPSVSLLSEPVVTAHAHFSTEELESRSREVEQRLLDFGIEVQVVAVHPGPVITRFELQLAPGLKVSKITSLGKDLARSLSVTSVRVVEVIPGKAVVGLELPNPSRDVVSLSEVLSTAHYANASSYLSLALGVDIAGHPVIVDLAKMPHLLVAGTTGSGKSVCINAMILSLILKATPEEVRLILVDPKMLELSIYEGIPHLLAPVVTDMRDAASSLRWCVVEMERRYRLMASLGVRSIASFNHKVKEAEKKGEPIFDPLIKPGEGMEQTPLTTLPKIVVVIDELADMMMVVGKKVEQLIARIAQKARASGIHLLLATQRPSVDVLTGLIKSNIPTRISFQVSSKIDSRTILDQQGAEQLLGQGDMLYLPPGTATPVRVHGAFVDDNEVHRIVHAWREVSKPNYIEDITSVNDENADGGMGGYGETEDRDPIYDEAVEFVVQSRKASISSVQRRFKIGYNRAARLVEEMERTGLVGPLEGGSREVLAPVRTED